MASGAGYDGWWNGGIRNTGNFHNIIAILTETIGSPTPMRIPLVISRQLPSRDQAYPIAPQEWRFRQSMDYSISFNRAVIDYAARNREHLLYNIYRMGRRSIERGNEDTWTPSPTRYAAVAQKMRGNAERGASPPDRDAEFWAELHKPEHRDPRGYVIPSNQPDFPTATKFINALREVNVTVHRATSEFDIGGKRYPAGSYVVLTAQAFRPHVIDMFEPQDHPNVIPYPGAPPTPPYDNAGWTLALQMGVQFDRILEPFSGPFERVTEWNVRPPAGQVTRLSGATGYLLSRAANDAVVAVNRLLAAGEDVRQNEFAVDEGAQAPSFFIAARRTTASTLEKIARDLGVHFTATKTKPGGARVSAARIGLWDRYGGSMESGWTRWILEQFEFPFARVFPQELDTGGLNAKYDVLVFPRGGIPTTQSGGRGGRGGAAPAPADVPAEYRSHMGQLTSERTLPRLREFVENGGTIVAIGDSAASLATHFAVPLDNAVPLPREKYFVPGSVLSAKVDASHPAAHGMSERADFFFDNSPVFRLKPGAAEAGVRPIAWFDSPSPLRSGWAWGQQYLNGGVIAVEARVGKGRVLLYGPEILQRAQPHGTFKLLFNALYRIGG
jgi:hypothetical protein